MTKKTASVLQLLWERMSEAQQRQTLQSLYEAPAITFDEHGIGTPRDRRTGAYL